VARQLDEQLLGEPQNLAQILALRNDDCFRKAALQKILDLLREPSSESNGPIREALSQPDSALRKAVIQNAEEDSPLFNTPSAVAQEIWSEMDALK
jgi:hypothetical protein